MGAYLLLTRYQKGIRADNISRIAQVTDYRTVGNCRWNATMRRLMMQRPNLKHPPRWNDFSWPVSWIDEQGRGNWLRTWNVDDPNAIPAAAFGSASYAQRVRANLETLGDVCWFGASYAYFDEVVGIAAYRIARRDRGLVGQILWLGVQPSSRRRGVATGLLKQIFYQMINRGIPSVELFVDSHQLPAIRLFLKFGFIPVYDVDGEDQRGLWSSVLQKMS